ncbi:hypothetical protein Tco_0938825 [Tanacetum coccineum]|uniref:Retrovirus-related Pol polyprotein from transposon TNT 1-94-like beta-barrel domain-containing protein n=1 Tax=Tanacetum coccineum TaxID=301880 RepID=A0ABQ5DIA7_9ASTR
MDLKQGEIIKAKSSMEEPPELKLKDLLSHLEYAYLEENEKLLVIIAKGLKDVEKEALLKVLKSHKQAIAWKITDIKGIDPHFCTYKILMEDDYKPTVQSQRRVNPKIHEVIKKEVLKLLDARMIYPISDSPWVSLVHCVPKKGGITVVANEENELILTRLVTGWRVYPNTKKNYFTSQIEHRVPSHAIWLVVMLLLLPTVHDAIFHEYDRKRLFLRNDVKGSTASSSSTQNVAFVSENTSSTNDVSLAYSVSNTSSQNSQYEQTSSYSLLANQSSCPQLDHEDLEQLDEFDLEEIDLKWQVAMISMRMKKSAILLESVEPREIKIIGEEMLRTLEIRMGEDLTSHSEEEEDYALMARNSSGSDTEREQLSDASIEIKAYTQGLKKVKAQIVAHQQGQLWYEEKIRFMKIDLDDKTDVLTYHKKLLAEAQKEKEDLKTKSQPSESKIQTSDFETCESDCSVETHESLPEPTVNEPKVVNQPKVWSDAPIIKEYESDSEDEHNQFTYSKNPKVDKKGLGYGFTTKACFVCGSLSHLIRDCDFHEKRMAKQVELNKKKGKDNVQRENKPVWNNVQRVNHKNQFVPRAVLTRTSKIPVSTAKASGTNNVSTARHNFKSQAVLTNAARKISTVKPFVNRVRPKTVFHKTHSPFRRPFNNTTALRTNFSKQKVNTAEDYPHRALHNKGIVDSGCFRHMTGNKAYLAECQDFNGGPVAFGGSKDYITGKGKIKIGKLDFEDVCFVKEL